MNKNILKFFYKIKEIDKSNFYEYLAIMLDGWLWLTQWIKLVKAKIKNPVFNEKLDELITYIDSWDSFSKSMKKVTNLFNASEFSIIEAWENSWTLVQSLTNLAEIYKKKYELRQKVKWALTYPIIIMCFLIIAIIVVMTYVIPKIVPLFDEMWWELPTSTKALISTSNFFTNNFSTIFILSIFWILSVTAFLKTEEWKASLDKLLLKLPLIWTLYKNYILAWIASNLWTLMWWWVWIIKTLLLVWKATNNYVYEEIFENVATSVWKWTTLIDSLLKEDKEWIYFPTDFIQMLAIWEKTASITKISKKLNNHFSKEVDYALANVTKWIEPIAISLGWVFVLWFAFSIFWAILNLTSSIW